MSDPRDMLGFDPLDPSTQRKPKPEQPAYPLEGGIPKGATIALPAPPGAPPNAVPIDQLAAPPPQQTPTPPPQHQPDVNQDQLVPVVDPGSRGGEADARGARRKALDAALQSQQETDAFKQYLNRQQQLHEQQVEFDKAYAREDAKRMAAEDALQRKQDAITSAQADFGRDANDLKQMQTDPDRWWKSRDTGQAVMAGLSIALGGLLMGMRGDKTNYALENVNRQIDRDVRAQMMDAMNKRGALSAKGQKIQQMIQAYGADPARQMLHAASLRMAANEAAARAAKLGQTQNQGEYQARLAQIHEQANRLDASALRNVAGRRASVRYVDPNTGVAMDEGHAQTWALDRAKERGKADAAQAGGSGQFAGVPAKELPRVRKLYAEAQGMDEQLDELDAQYNAAADVATSAAVDLTGTSNASKRQKALLSKVSTIIQKNWKGPMTEPDQKRIIDPLMPSATDSPEDRKLKLDQLKAAIRGGSTVAKELEQYGISVGPNKYKLPSSFKPR